LTQSNAILFYAEERSAGRLLPQAGSTARVRALEAFFYFTTDVVALNGAAFILESQRFPEAAGSLRERRRPTLWRHELNHADKLTLAAQ
jgi:glutathione S-transferase